MKRHATGITLVLTVALAVGLSLAPLPDFLRPIPSLRRDAPLQTIAQAFLPQKRDKARAQDFGAAGSDGQLANASENGGGAASEHPPSALELAARDDSTPAPPLPIAFTLGADEARNVRRLERMVDGLGAKHVDIEEPCLAKDAAGACTRHALDPFFSEVEALQRGERTSPVRIVHLGDSQIASDYISDTIRRRLELRYGSAGPGFLFVDRPTKFAGRKVRTGEATDGWSIVKLTDKEREGLLGFSGVRFTATEGRQRTTFDVRHARYADISFATEQRGGTLEVFADETPVSRLYTRFSDEALAHAKVTLPNGAKTLSLAAVGGKVSVFGVSLETGGPGIVYDSVGLPGAMYEVFLRAPESTFASQLRRRHPSLVIAMFGGNEAYEMGRGWQTIDTVKKNAKAFTERLHAAAPDAACLMFAPMDAGTRTVGGEIEPRAHTEEVAAAVREVALENGCAYWDLYTALGGAGAAGRWLAKGLFNEDLVHPLPAGAEVIGHLFDFALERARVSRPHPVVSAADADVPGLIDATGGKALTKTLAKLDALKAHPDTERVSIVQLGASHTASHMFTDVVRTDLAEVFGNGGRGFVAAGKPSDRLAAAHVKRELRGDWQIIDALSPLPPGEGTANREGAVPDRREAAGAAHRGEIFGLTGIRAVGQPGAATSITFGDGQDGGDAPATLSLYVLDGPDQGRRVLRIDGKEVPEPTTETAAIAPPHKGRHAWSDVRDESPPRASGDEASASSPSADEHVGAALRASGDDAYDVSRSGDENREPAFRADDHHATASSPTVDEDRDSSARAKDGAAVNSHSGVPRRKKAEKRGSSQKPPVAEHLANAEAPASPSPPHPGPLPVGEGIRILRFPVTGTSHTIEVENAGPGTLTVFGASLEKERGGIVYDALGLPGATATVVDGYDRASFVEELRSRHADLYVLFFGTNESADPALDLDEVRASNHSLLQKLREAAPASECLIIGPTDRLAQRADGTWIEAPSNTAVVKTLRDVAAAEGCAFWSARAAMGGPRSMTRWQSLEPALGHEDGVHLTKEGYAALAHAFNDDLLAAYHSAYPPAAAPTNPANPATATSAKTPSKKGAR